MFPIPINLYGILLIHPLNARTPYDRHSKWDNLIKKRLLKKIPNKNSKTGDKI